MTRNIGKIAAEAARIRKDYPELSYKEAIEKAEKVIKKDPTPASNKGPK